MTEEQIIAALAQLNASEGKYNKERIIAALNQLNAIQDEHKEWLATRKQIGADIDPDNVHVCWDFAQVLDPYGICSSSSFPTELDQIGREYFARASNGGIRVSFDDLPTVTVSKLWQRMQAGDFDSEPDVDGMNMFFQPTEGWLAAVPLAGRLAIRGTSQTHGPLIVKDADLGAFQLTVDVSHDTCYLAGWIEVGAAKQFPSLTARGSAVHFIEQSQLRSMDDLQNFLETGLGNG